MSEIPKKPRFLWNAIIALYFQVVTNAGGGVLLVYFAGVEADHGRDAPEMAVLGYVSIVIAVVLLAGAVLVTRGIAWARIPITVFESLSVLSGLFTLVSGVVTGVAGIALGALVLVTLFRREANDWFADVAEIRLARR
jgi:hypothetical protein